MLDVEFYLLQNLISKDFEKKKKKKSNQENQHSELFPIPYREKQPRQDVLLPTNLLHLGLRSFQLSLQQKAYIMLCSGY